MNKDRFLSMFFEEARELLEALESGLMDLEARQSDRAHLDRTFRAAHTLKGAAGMVGLRGISQFTHGVETVLGRIRDGTLPVQPVIITTLLEARDYLDTAVTGAVEGQTIEPSVGLSERLGALAAGTIPAVPAAAPEPEPEPERSPVQCYRITLAPGAKVLELGTNPLGMLDELRELGQTRVFIDVSRVPPLAELDPHACCLSWIVGLETTAPRERLDEVFLFLDDPRSVTIEPVASLDAVTAPAMPTLSPVGRGQGEGLPGKVPIPSPPPSPQRGEGAGFETLSPAGRGQGEGPKPTTPPAEPRAKPTARLKVDAEQLDELLGLAGELAILTDSLQGLREIPAAAPWSGTLEVLDRLGRRLRDTTLELRMVPIEELFARFPRVVRDTADRSGKQIHLEIRGEDTRLDRTIIERLAEPMIHMIRNGIDHGLEPPAERIAAGKSPTGRLVIAAGYEGDRVVIRVEDDGRGLDRAKIAKKGIALGMLPPEISPDDPRVGNLIFEAGFSTKEQVGELSGRGVGLDVVRDTIRSLRGAVTVRSTLDKGTTFIIHLPLTLALIDGLLVEVNGGRYVVPMTQVDECVALSADDPAWSMRRQAVIVRGDLVPIVPMRRAFGAPECILPRQEMLLTHHAEERVGVVVDSLLGRVQTVIQPLDEGLGRYRHFSGATILGDGSICLIVDLATVVGQSHISAMTVM